jgi:hypothetical protein
MQLAPLHTGRPYLIRLIGRRDIPGMDFAGVVVETAVADTEAEADVGVNRLALGDHVFGTVGLYKFAHSLRAHGFSP